VTEAGGGRTTGAGWRGWVVAGALLGAALVLRTWVFGLVTVPTASMAPTLLPGEIALYWKFQEPAVGDVVVVDRDDGVLHIKRVVAIGGDEVEISAGRLYVNGSPIREAAGEAARWEEEGVEGCRERSAATVIEAREARRWRVIPGGEHERERVPEGTIFLLGDHRPSSSDSRQWGASPRQAARGVVASLVWSRSPCGDLRPDRVGSLE